MLSRVKVHKATERVGNMRHCVIQTTEVTFLDMIP